MTQYSPPRANLTIEDIRRMLQKNMPVYIWQILMLINRLFFGHGRSNNKGKIIKELIDQDIANHLGLDFPMLIGETTKLDMILSNRYGFLNIVMEPGGITTSDNVPIKIKVSTRAILKYRQPRRDYSKANWTNYKEMIDEEILKEERENPRDENSLPQIDKEKKDKMMGNWITAAGRAAS